MATPTSTSRKSRNAVAAPRAARETVKRRKVSFTIQDARAHDAALAGTFNDWQPQPLKAAKSPGSFTLTLLLPPGEYEYMFLIDGQWRNDTACSETVPNPFGGSNSLLRVA
jgi:1,4-alpha-glucan branching enzyme